MKPIRNLPAGAREAREMGGEAYANDETLWENRENIAHYYGKTWEEMTDTEMAEATVEFRNGIKEEKENS